MDISMEQLKIQYQKMSMEEIEKLVSTDTLTKLATDVATEELRSRGFTEQILPKSQPKEKDKTQKTTSVEPNTPDPWLWILATIGGWIIGMIAIAAFPNGVFSIRSASVLHISIGISIFAPFATFTGIIALGTSVGIAQWLVLKKIFHGSGWWVLATIAGWLVGFSLVSVFNTPELFNVVLFGLSVGIAQWFVLRQRVSGAGWWVIATIGAIIISDLVNDAIMSPNWLLATTPLKVSWAQSLPRYFLPWAFQGLVIGAVTIFALKLIQYKSEIKN